MAHWLVNLGTIGYGMATKNVKATAHPESGKWAYGLKPLTGASINPAKYVGNQAGFTKAVNTGRKVDVGVGAGQALGSAAKGISDFKSAMDATSGFVNAATGGAVNATAQETADCIMSRTKKYVPDYRMSGVGNALLSVQIKPFSNYKYYMNSVEGHGPWGLIDKDTRAHTIYPKNKKALRFNDRFAAHVQHPGTKGKHIWRDCEKEAEESLLKNGGKLLIAAAALVMDINQAKQGYKLFRKGLGTPRQLTVPGASSSTFGAISDLFKEIQHISIKEPISLTGSSSPITGQLAMSF